MNYMSRSRELGRVAIRDLHGPGGPAGQAGTSRAHKPTKWNRPGRAGLSHPMGRASRADMGQFS